MATGASNVTYLGQEAAQQFDNALFYDYEYSIDQLMEIAGIMIWIIDSPVYIWLSMSECRRKHSLLLQWNAKFN